MTGGLIILIVLVLLLLGLGWLTYSLAQRNFNYAPLIKTVGWGLILVITVIYLWLAPKMNFSNQAKIGMITIDNYPFAVKVATSSADQAKGLMGVTKLGDQQGMLFIWNKPGHQKMWMKDTLIPLDMLFFNDQKILVGSNGNVPPCPTAIKNCPIYDGNSQTTQYVVEVAGGTSERDKFVVGQTKLEIHLK